MSDNNETQRSVKSFLVSESEYALLCRTLQKDREERQAALEEAEKSDYWSGVAV